MAETEPEKKEAPPPLMETEPTVVYRRAQARVEARWGSRRADGEQPSIREIAPTITPLVIGFALLLLVIFVLGYRSINLIDQVGSDVLTLEQTHAARGGLLLELRLALTKLDNEARARRDAESDGGFMPPFELQLRTARENMKDLLVQLERPPLSTEPRWMQFRADLQEYVAVTEDLRRYSLEGFPKFGAVDRELNDLFADSRREEAEVFIKSAAIQQNATHTVRVWSLTVLLAGLLVAAGTVWEVQRRFKQVRRSVVEARRERSFSTQMLQGMVSAVVAIDENDRIRSANRAFFDIYPHASIGSLVREKFAPDDAMKMLEVATSSRVQQATYRGRWICQSDTPGSEKSYDVYSSPLAIEEDKGQLVTLVDVTEAAEAERVVRRNESLAAVGQATTQVAHEIRNPLGSIRLGVSMLRDSVGGDKDALRTIELVERGITHLNKLVVDVTQFSRQKPLERSQVDLNDLLNRSSDLVADRLKSKDATIKREFRAERVVGFWDADQLAQVFLNLIANAVDASPQHSAVTIATELAQVPESAKKSNGMRGVARITISDQGSGIDQANLSRIFTPFFTTKKRGTGLGLAIVKQIVENHGGEITARSEPGNGAQFTIDLPL